MSPYKRNRRGLPRPNYTEPDENDFESFIEPVATKTDNGTPIKSGRFDHGCEPYSYTESEDEGSDYEEDENGNLKGFVVDDDDDEEDDEEDESEDEGSDYETETESETESETETEEEGSDYKSETESEKEGTVLGAKTQYVSESLPSTSSRIGRKRKREQSDSHEYNKRVKIDNNVCLKIEQPHNIIPENSFQKDTSTEENTPGFKKNEIINYGDKFYWHGRLVTNEIFTFSRKSRMIRFFGRRK